MATPLEPGVIKTCPRCGRPFTCRADQVDRCDCKTVILSAQTLDYLRAQGPACLCVDCLRALEERLAGTA